MTRVRPWGDIALRLLACGLLFATGFTLLSTSAFALRMRDDAPPFVPGLDGPQSIAFALALALALAPLLFPRRFLAAFLVSSFLVAGIGAYWWTLAPWDEYVTDSDFPTAQPPSLLSFLLVMSPAFVAAFYAAASAWSRMRADLLARGADRDEAARAAAASFLAGAGAIVVSAALAVLLAGLLAAHALGGVPWLVGVPAVALAGALVAVAYLLGARRFPRGKKNAPPSGGPASRESRARSGGGPTGRSGAKPVRGA